LCPRSIRCLTRSTRDWTASRGTRSALAPDPQRAGPEPRRAHLRGGRDLPLDPARAGGLAGRWVGAGRPGRRVPPYGTDHCWLEPRCRSTDPAGCPPAPIIAAERYRQRHPWPGGGAAAQARAGLRNGRARAYQAESSANTLAGGAAVAGCNSCLGGEKVGDGGALTFNGVTADSAGVYLVLIEYCDGRTATPGCRGRRTRPGTPRSRRRTRNSSLPNMAAVSAALGCPAAGSAPASSRARTICGSFLTPRPPAGSGRGRWPAPDRRRAGARRRRCPRGRGKPPASAECRPCRSSG